MWRFSLLVSIFLPACAVQPAAASLDALAATEARGTVLVYEGTVTPNGAAVPRFSYQRFVQHDGPSWVSRHDTRDLQTDAVIVRQTATHSADYEFTSLVQEHAQDQTLSHAVMMDDGRLQLSVERNGRTKTRTERPRGPVVVGPTLFGFVRQHWDELAAGDTVDVRFLVAEQARTYGFVLRREAVTDSTTTVSLSGAGVLVRASVAPMRLVFDNGSRKILEYAGRVPPRVKPRKALDAVVTYEHRSLQ